MYSGKLRTGRNREAGVTLVEVILVVTIIGVLAGVLVLSSMRSTAHWELVTAARTLVSDLRATRDIAFNTGEQSTLWIYQQGGQYNNGFYMVYDAERQVWKDVYLPKTVRFSHIKGFQKVVASQVYRVNFYPQTSGSGTVTLESATGESRYVKVYGNTARVRLSETP
ncbi:MAG TPA: type II secretion system protein [Desulfotomaculum sp.]|nr:type II secretion system protein [Desulfotomaculum sp.]